jgi:hypothetical protein
MSSTPSSGRKLADAFLRVKLQAWAVPPSALAMTRPEMLKIQTAALGIMRPELTKQLAASVVASKVFAVQPFRLPPRYLDHLWKGSEVASFTNVIKTLQLDLPDFSKLVVHQGLFDRLDVSLSEDGSAAPAIEAGTAVILRTHPGLSRGAERLLFIACVYLILVSCAYYVMITYPESTQPLLAALGLSAKEIAVISGKLFDQINPPEDLD